MSDKPVFPEPKSTGTRKGQSRSDSGESRSDSDHSGSFYGRSRSEYDPNKPLEEPSDLQPSKETRVARAPRIISPATRVRKSRVDSIDAAIAAVEERSERARRRKRVRAVTVTYPKLNDANELWAAAYEEAIGGRPESGATGKEWAIFRRATQRNPVTDLPIFFADVCNTWTALKSGPLSWVDEFPELPRFSTLCYFVRQIRGALVDAKATVAKHESRLKGDAGRGPRFTYQPRKDEELVPFSARNGSIHVRVNDIEPQADDIVDTTEEERPSEILSEYTSGQVRITIVRDSNGVIYDIMFTSGGVLYAPQPRFGLPTVEFLDDWAAHDAALQSTDEPRPELFLGAFRVFLAEGEVYLYSGARAGWRLLNTVGQSQANQFRVVCADRNRNTYGQMISTIRTFLSYVT